MARIRSIKPEIRKSLTVSSWPYVVRWTFAGLLGYVDDEGRGIDDVRLTKAELYPLDDDMTPRKVDRHLDEIAASGPLCRYEVDGRRYLHLVNWSEHQRVNRPSPSRIPPCLKHESSLNDHGVLTEPSLNPHVARTEPSLPSRAPAEQGTGNREQGTGKVLPTTSAQTVTALAVVETPTAQTIIGEWIDHAPKRPPQQVIGQTAKSIAAMLAEGIDPDDVRRGVAAWMDKGLHPSALPSVVNEVMNSSPRRSTTDQRVTAGLELAARLRAAERKAIG